MTARLPAVTPSASRAPAGTISPVTNPEVDVMRTGPIRERIDTDGGATKLAAAASIGRAAMICIDAIPA